MKNNEQLNAKAGERAPIKIQAIQHWLFHRLDNIIKIKLSWNFLIKLIFRLIVVNCLWVAVNTAKGYLADTFASLALTYQKELLQYAVYCIILAEISSKIVSGYTPPISNINTGNELSVTINDTNIVKNPSLEKPVQKVANLPFYDKTLFVYNETQVTLRNIVVVSAASAGIAVAVYFGIPYIIECFKGWSGGPGSGNKSPEGPLPTIKSPEVYVPGVGSVTITELAGKASPHVTFASPLTTEIPKSPLPPFSPDIVREVPIISGNSGGPVPIAGVRSEPFVLPEITQVQNAVPQASTAQAAAAPTSIHTATPVSAVLDLPANTISTSGGFQYIEGFDDAYDEAIAINAKFDAAKNAKSK